MRRNTVLLEHTRDAFTVTPSAESWQFRTVRSGRGTGWPYFVKSPNDSMCPQAARAGVTMCFLFVVFNFDALTQASDIRIEMRQVVLLCWMQDSNPEGLWSRISSRLNARWQTDWAIQHQAIEDQAKNFNSTARPYDQRAWYPNNFPISGNWLFSDIGNRFQISRFPIQRTMRAARQGQTAVTDWCDGI